MKKKTIFFVKRRNYPSREESRKTRGLKISPRVPLYLGNVWSAQEREANEDTVKGVNNVEAFFL